ncbi:DUF885 domain-containing protein [Pedomonas mirosovicensis]|uniref:DUF885 domain-containing protein n=1 Tax=Pedomonas mirosovicensis TaxID=2908641 RepID=UPI002166C2A5|nr:DUF885 domain-containing protein [Pedomonas mirosovicensis]MCH8683961.1 DUF885 domain-containing protein [Pedomonas mirosovicensis]
MSNLKTWLRLSMAALPFAVLAACATKQPPEPVAVVKPSADQQLAQLFKDSDETNLRLNPINALARGDMRYADRIGDYLSDEYAAAVYQAKQQDLARLATIDRSALSPDNAIYYDVFKYETELALRFASKPLETIQTQLPIDHFYGMHTFFPDLSSGQSIAPYKTVKDYEDGLKRMDNFVVVMDRAIVRMREGINAGHVQPQVVVNNVIGQLDTIIKQGVENSTYYLPIKNMPADFSASDKARLTQAYQDKIANTILPVYQRLKTFMETEYKPHARRVPGLLGMKDGPLLYSALVEQHTTTKMTPNEIHEIGLKEVARITREMEAIKNQVGFKGTLKQFFEHLRTDPQFKFKSKDELLAAYNSIRARVDAGMPRLFNRTVKTPFEIRPVPAFIEKNQAGAYYMSGSADGTRPGVFYVNTYDLPSRTKPGMETLFLHEAVPGHHYQISLAQETPTIPDFLRFGGNNAYTEGWGLYAESLGKELGLLTDPYQQFGRLDDEMLRAMRLVVDTGIHAKGWTREQAIKYMLDNSAMGETDATAEVERYIAIPGQALAYKIGQLTIRRLRTEAEQQLGPKFDVRAFHEQVLGTGALPMTVLEAKIRNWIAVQKASV